MRNDLMYSFFDVCHKIHIYPTTFVLLIIPFGIIRAINIGRELKWKFPESLSALFGLIFALLLTIFIIILQIFSWLGKLI